MVDKYPNETLLEADAEPCLWKERAFVQSLLELLIKSTPPADYLRAADHRLTSCRLAVTLRGDAVEIRGRANQFEAAGYSAIARLMRPGVSKSEILVGAIRSIRKGHGTDNCWREIAGLVRDGKLDPDPLLELLDELRELGPDALGDLDKNGRGWKTFANACTKHPALAYAHEGRVPALDVACFLCPDRTLGQVGMDLVRAIVPAPQRSQGAQQGARIPCDSVEWWDAFFATVDTCRRRDGSLHPQAKQDSSRLGLADDARRYFVSMNRRYLWNTVRQSQSHRSEKKDAADRT